MYGLLTERSGKLTSPGKCSAGPVGWWGVPFRGCLLFNTYFDGLSTHAQTLLGLLRSYGVTHIRLRHHVMRQRWIVEGALEVCGRL